MLNCSDNVVIFWSHSVWFKSCVNRWKGRYNLTGCRSMVQLTTSRLQAFNRNSQNHAKVVFAGGNLFYTLTMVLNWDFRLLSRVNYQIYKKIFLDFMLIENWECWNSSRSFSVKANKPLTGHSNLTLNEIYRENWNEEYIIRLTTERTVIF